jgi:hypothetical protein
LHYQDVAQCFFEVLHVGSPELRWQLLNPIRASVGIALYDSSMTFGDNVILNAIFFDCCPEGA